ncbi:MAG: MBL fold metallo-hydrolase [Alphaproteobacteria bacterium]
MDISRRTFGKLSLATALASSVPLSSNVFGQDRQINKRLDVLSDGYMQFPATSVFGDIPAQEYEAVLTANGASTTVLKPDCNLTLLRDGERTILFDVGAGPYFLETTGKLLDAFDELEVDPQEVTDVVFTHAHPDHLWGLIDDFDELFFSEAAYHISKVERDYWLSDKALQDMPESRKTFAVGAKRLLGEIEDRLIGFDFDTEVLSGIYAHKSVGHTQGHTSFEVEINGESLNIVGDAITNAHAAFQRPDWGYNSDQDIEVARLTRKALLDRMASDKSGLVGFHLPYPGMGRVEHDGLAYRFVAA